MKLNYADLSKRPLWDNAEISIPNYNIDALISATFKRPKWVHFGAGNIFRVFIAGLADSLLRQGLMDSGIIAVEAFDSEIIEKIYKPHNNLSLSVIMGENGSMEKQVVASVAESMTGNPGDLTAWKRLQEIFKNPSLQMVSFTITEKGYSTVDLNGDLLPSAAKDIERGPEAPVHMISIVASLLHQRYTSGQAPIAMVSMDNCSHNGDILKTAVLKIAEGWAGKGFVDSGFVAYLADSNKVAFPWSMIDKITPRPSAQVEKSLEALGLEDMNILCTSKNTYIAPFVNAEASQYLIIEDTFPKGRPPLEAAGVLFADRTQVENAEKMKVTTCLNPLHTALAIFGCLLGFHTIYEEMKDSALKALVCNIGYDEGMAVVIDSGILDPLDFIKEVIDVRFPNPFIPDTPQRIATDTSQKLPVRFGVTINGYWNRSDLSAKDLTFIPLVIAAWCRYLLGVDDQGDSMELSPDPMLEELTGLLAGITPGKPETFTDQLRPILSNPALFAVDLYAVGLGEKIEAMFREMLAGNGAVRATLEKYLNQQQGGAGL